MKGEIIGFEKQIIQEEIEEDGKKKIQNIPMAIISIRTPLPDLLPIGNFVEIKTIKDK